MNTTLLADLGVARRKLVIGLLSGLAALTVMYLAMFPSIQAQLEVFAAELPDSMRALIGNADLATPEGYLRSEVFALTAPLVISALAIVAGTALARSERDRTLGAVFGTPLSRRVLAGTHLAAVWLVALLGGLTVLACLVFGAPLVGAEVGAAPLVAASLQLVLLAAAMGSVAFAAASATGAPLAGLGVGWGTISTAFVANGAAELIDGAEWIASVSPWGWYGGGAALTDGFDIVGAGLLAALAATGGALGIVAFERRDLGL